MNNNINYVTKESLDQMKDELMILTGIGRQGIAKAIAEAREKGDLKENAEYDAAKEAQAVHESKIAKLQNIISNARILEASNIDTSKVSVLTKVKIQNLNNQQEIEYQIVSEKEADLKVRKISINSPIGRGLLGKIIGDIAEVQTPTGVVKFKIINISI